ncbi:MAG TPA: LLM class flavin-dependent oxidoreductase [Mycobacterium sp.]|nr:LLM class flavin-dependent oxidoreductase [Mycobacterium sp.]
MTVIGFHCSHEQISPARLLQDVQHAERAGFTAGMSSDHLSPWSVRQNESGFAWSFLGAALATTNLPFGVVNAPGQRYHPVIIAQAIATLAQHAEWLAEYVEQGWDELYLHFVGQHQTEFIDAFGAHVLPQLSPTAPATTAAMA